ncbi:hypothetical protein NKH92_24375 [Mesorhizobium sp. M0871]|uniref:hypothetical protein n=1 Tax=Mesorhizobium sp. M0871 TaxID=2957017 RepID=UPI003337001F
MDIMTALASASHVIIVRLKPCLSFLPLRSLSGTPLRLQGRSLRASPLPYLFRFALEFLAPTPEFHDEAGHVRLRVASTVIVRCDCGEEGQDECRPVPGR